MNPASPRPLNSIPIVESTGLAPQLGPFPELQSFATFRGLDVAQQPLQNATQAQGALALQNNGHLSHSHNGMVVLAPDQSLQQGAYGALMGDEADATEATNFAGQLTGMRLIPDPPDLEYWRHRLFHVDDVITLSEEQ